MFRRPESLPHLSATFATEIRENVNPDVLSPFPRQPAFAATEIRENANPDVLSPFPRQPAFADTGQKALGAANTLSPFQLTPILHIPLPDTFDQWRQEGYLSPPPDQARCGACYAFAAVGQLADRIAIATRRKVRHSLSTQFVVSCLQSKYQYGCGGTLDVPLIYEALMPEGLLGGTYLDDLFPYSGQQWDPKPDPDPRSPCYYTPGAPECLADDRDLSGKVLALPAHCYPPRASTGMACTGTVPCDTAYIRRWYPHEPKFSFAKVYHLSENTNARYLFPNQAEMEHYRLSIPVSMTLRQLNNNTRRIKEAIYLYGPVTAVIPIYRDFEKKFTPGGPHWNDRNYVYEVDRDAANSITGLHHVLLVGWGHDPAGPYWIVKNSWGVWWNYDGYFNVRMGDPFLLIESNCHSAIPFNPETGEVMAAFDHEDRDGGRPFGDRSPAVAVLAVIWLSSWWLLLRGRRTENGHRDGP